MPKPPDYDKIEKDMWRTNSVRVQKQAADRAENVMKKVDTYVWRFGSSVQAVLDKIANDQMFANWFTKEPRRQTLHEKVAAKWIRELDGVEGFVDLPNNGKGAYYINSDGEIHEGKPNFKSLDFMWRSGKSTCYATHKYTKEGGGNQDSQFKEVVATMRRFQNGKVAKNIVLFAILDGPYYTKAKFEEIRSHARTTPPLSYAIPIEELPGIIEQIS